MRWAKPSLRNSFLGWLGFDDLKKPEAQAERVRLAMLFALDEYCDYEHRLLEHKITYSRNIEELWFVRPHLLQVIAASQGEAIARNALDKITVLFEGCHPGGKPSALGKR
jgi:hypothetical protein